MPRETIRKLSEDTERLLLAGAHLAASDGALVKDKAALEKVITKLGAKAPAAFGKLIEQIDATLAAKGSEQAGALLTLSSSLAQVRAGLAQLSPVADDTSPVPAAPPVQTPCNGRELYALHDALVTQGSGRLEKIEEAITRDDVADLRLVHAVVQAMGDSWVGDTVSDKVVPKFGRAIVEPVRKKLRFPGKKVDGRRLRALVAVEKDAAQPLVEQALREGSAEVRAAALEAIADHLPGVPALEPIALGILAKERAGDVRRAAVRALAGYAGDASFEQLLLALDDHRTVGGATEALGLSRHPRVVDELLGRLDAAATAARAKVKKDDKDGEAKKEAARHLAAHLLQALAQQAKTSGPDPRVAAAARALSTQLGLGAFRVLLAHGDEADVRSVADLLSLREPGYFPLAVEATTRLPPDEAFQRLKSPLEDEDRGTKLGEARLLALSNAAFEPRDPRWLPLLTKLAETHPSATVFGLLGRTGDPGAVAPVLAAFERSTDKQPYVYACVEALRRLGDRRALPALLARIVAKDWSLGWSIRNAVIDLAEESTVGLVRERFAALPEKVANDSWYLKSLLRSLERKFPGS